MTQGEKVKAVARILKLRFPNMQVLEVIELAYDIVEVLEEPK